MTASRRPTRGRFAAMSIARRFAVPAALWLAIAGWLVPAALAAQFPGLPGSGARPAQAEQVVSPLSPRAAVQEFLRLVGAEDWDSAAAYLSLSPTDRPRAALLARRLGTVLNQRLALDPRLVSPLVTGDTADGDPASERLGVITGPAGREDPVLLVRARSGAPAWVFAPSTVSSIDAWFENLGNPWLRDRLSPALMREGPLRVFIWQWIGIAIAIPLLLLLTWLAGKLARSVLARVTRRTSAGWDDLLVERLEGPFRLWAAALIAAPLLTFLDLNARVSAFIMAATRVMVLLALFWAILRAIRLMQERMENVAWAAGHTQQARTLAPLVGNFLRVTLVIIAVLVALAQFGYPVGTLLAGLGIGGIAVALAAQKTVEHLFGSVSLAADKAFRVGDWVRAGATEGAVERIGLRSTSFRTNDRTVVRVPNGRLADERIETFGERDRILLRTDIDLTYDTSTARLETIRDQVARHLAAHPKIWPDAMRVHVVAFTDSAIRINVMAWFLTADYMEFLEIRHGMLLEFMRIVERNGSSFAFPSRTVYHVSQDGAGGAPQAPGAVAAGTAMQASPSAPDSATDPAASSPPAGPAPG